MKKSFNYSQKWFSYYPYGSLASRGHQFLPPFKDSIACTTSCHQLQFNLIDHPKDFSFVSSRSYVTPGHTAFVNAGDDLIISRGLSYRFLDEDPVLRSYAEKCFKGQEYRLKNPSARPSFMIGGTQNYGHFIFEFLPKAVFALMHFGPEIDLYINTVCSKFFPLINYICRHMYGVEANIIDYDVPTRSYLSVEKVFFLESTFLRFPREYTQSVYFCFRTLRFINEALRACFPAPSEPDLLIYSPRGSDAKHRLLANSGEMRSLFKDNGFKIIDLGSLSQPEQITLMSRTKCLVTEAGAAGAIATLCPPGAHIIDLFPDNVVGGCASVTTTIPLKQKYTRLRGSLETSNTGIHLSDTDYLIPLSDITSHPDLFYLFKKT